MTQVFQHCKHHGRFESLRIRTTPPDPPGIGRAIRRPDDKPVYVPRCDSLKIAGNLQAALHRSVHYLPVKLYRDPQIRAGCTA